MAYHNSVHMAVLLVYAERSQADEQAKVRSHCEHHLGGWFGGQCRPGEAPGCELVLRHMCMNNRTQTFKVYRPTKLEPRAEVHAGAQLHDERASQPMPCTDGDDKLLSQEEIHVCGT